MLFDNNLPGRLARAAAAEEHLLYDLGPWFRNSDAGLGFDLRQWVPLSDARLIYEARRGLAAEELEAGYGGDPERLICSIWDVAFDKRKGLPPSWCWLWRQPAG